MSIRVPLLLCLGAALACDGQTFTVSVDGLPAPAGGDEHATTHHTFRGVTAEIWCESGEEFEVCVLEIVGDDQRSTGERRSLTLNLPADAASPDLSTLPVGYPAGTFAHTDDVSGEHPTFDWVCTAEEGTVTLDAAPRPGQVTTGTFVLTSTCDDRLGGVTTPDVGLAGDFVIVATGADPAADPAARPLGAAGPSSSSF